MRISSSSLAVTALLLTCLFVLAPTPVMAQSPAETLVLFDASAAETPESIIFDRFDNAYICLSTTGEIRRIAPDLTQSTVATLPIGAPCGAQPTVTLGLAMDRQNTLYAAVSACDPANQGLWKIDIDTGAIELVANAPSATVLNGIDVYKGYLYAADTFDGLIWRAPADGSGTLEVWADHPLLKRPPGAFFPGPNGLKVFRREVYTAVSATGQQIAFPILPDGSAGEPRVHSDISPQGCDEFTFDVHGNMYCTTDPFNTILRIAPDGSFETLLTAADLLDGPTSVAFGRRGQNRKNLYITNAAFPIFTTTFRPSLMRLPLDLPGAPE